MPSTIDDVMMSRSARNRLCSASGMIVAGSRVPIPVRVTIPMILPTHAAAATSGTTPRAAATSPSIVRCGLSLVVGLKLLTMTMVTSERLTARNAV